MSGAYYNEIDPFAAEWLRRLIAEEAIAPGVVDERSICEVQPEDLAGFTQVHLFAGIGVWSYALRCAGWPDDRPIWTGSCPCQPFSSAGSAGADGGLGQPDIERRPERDVRLRERGPLAAVPEAAGNGGGGPGPINGY